ncbi:MAG: hypothetical protein IKX68_05730 [Clostridiales bacterium]|nr:hypothetical protein [Clostridiales bacterium]
MKKTVAILLVVSVVLCCGCKKQSRRSKFDDDKTIENIEDFEEYLGKKLDADKKNQSNYVSEDYAKGFYSTDFINDQMTSIGTNSFLLLNKTPEDQLSDYVTYVKVNTDFTNKGETLDGSDRLRSTYEILTSSYSNFEEKENAVNYFKKRCSQIETAMNSTADELELAYELADSNYRPWYAELYQVYATDHISLENLDENIYYFNEKDDYGYIRFNVDISTLEIPEIAKADSSQPITRKLYNASVVMVLDENSIITACSYSLVNSANDPSKDFAKSPLADDDDLIELCANLGIPNPYETDLSDDLQILFGGYLRIQSEPSYVIHGKKTRLSNPNDI